MDYSPQVHDACPEPHKSWMDGERRQAIAHLDHFAPGQGHIQTRCEVRLHQELLILQMQESKFEMLLTL